MSEAFEAQDKLKVRPPIWRARSLALKSCEQECQEGYEAQRAADGVQPAPTPQQLLCMFGGFVEGGIEEALVGGEDDD